MGRRIDGDALLKTAGKLMQGLCADERDEILSLEDLKKLVETEAKVEALLERERNKLIGGLKPCPWCGRAPYIVATDEEGNTPYKPMPKPGGYSIFHTSEGAEDNCPIATDPSIALGMWLYDTEEEAVEAWNRRAEG